MGWVRVVRWEEVAGAIGDGDLRYGIHGVKQDISDTELSVIENDRTVNHYEM